MLYPAPDPANSSNLLSGARAIPRGSSHSVDRSSGAVCDALVLTRHSLYCSIDFAALLAGKSLVRGTCFQAPAASSPTSRVDSERVSHCLRRGRVGVAKCVIMPSPTRSPPCTSGRVVLRTCVRLPSVLFSVFPQSPSALLICTYSLADD